MSAIRGPDGALKSDIDGILHSWVTFFPSLFSASPTDASVQDELLNNAWPGCHRALDTLVMASSQLLRSIRHLKELLLVSRQVLTDSPSNSIPVSGISLGKTCLMS